MNYDLVIQALEFAADNSDKTNFAYHIIDKALAEMRAARDAPPVGWFDWDAEKELWFQVYPHTHGKPLYAGPVGSKTMARFENQEYTITLGEKND
jgi:hypothetical protein